MSCTDSDGIWKSIVFFFPSFYQENVDKKVHIYNGAPGRAIRNLALDTIFNESHVDNYV